MGVAEQPLGVGEGALVQRDGLAQPPSLVIGGGEVVAEGQGAGVGIAEQPLAVGEGALVERDSLARPPGLVIGGCEVVAEAQRVGVGVAEQPLGIRNERFTVLDGLGEAVECVRFFVRGDFSLSGSGCLSGVFPSRYLMPWFPVCVLP